MHISWFTVHRCVCVHEGELCRDMFISSEDGVCPLLAHIRFSTLWNQETLVNRQALFTADHALFTFQWHMDPWVLFQLSGQQREHRRSHIGGSLSDLRASVWEDRDRHCDHPNIVFMQPNFIVLFSFTFFFLLWDKWTTKIDWGAKALLYLITRQTHCYRKWDINEFTYFILKLYDKVRIYTGY